MKPIQRPLLAAALVCLTVPVTASGESETSGIVQPFSDQGDVLVVYSSGLDGLLVDGRDTGLRRVLGMVDKRLLELPRDLQSSTFPARQVQLATDLLTRPYCLRLGLDDVSRPDSFRAQLTVQADDRAGAERWADVVSDMLRAVGLESGTAHDGSSIRACSTPGGPLYFGTDVADGKPVFQVGFKRLMEEPFRYPNTGLPRGVEPAFYAHLDTGQISGLLQMVLSSQGAQAAGAWNLLEFAGLVGADATPRTWAFGFGKDQGWASARVEGFVDLARRNGVLVEEPLQGNDFERIPADATWVSMNQFRFEGLLGFLDRIEPGASEQARAGIQQVCGLDLQGDVLAHLGPTISLYGSTTTGGGGLLSSVAVIETSDPVQLDMSLNVLRGKLMKFAEQKAQRRVAFQNWSYGETHCATLVFPGLPIPLEVSYAVVADNLVLTLSPIALRGALDQLSAKSSLWQHPRLAGFQPDKLQGAIRFHFLDAPFFVERGYGGAMVASSLLSNLMRSPYEPNRNPGSVLPPLGRLTKGVRPWVGWGRIENGDLVDVAVVDRSWTVNATALIGTPLSKSYAGVAGVAMISSIAIPKLMSARLSANEAAAIATLRNVASAQAQAQAMGAVDTNGDHTGEFAFFGEMSGARPVRIKDGLRVGAGQPGVDNVNPPLLSSAFGELLDDGTGEAVVQRSGYYFKIWLPGTTRNGVTRGIAERVGFRLGEAPETDSSSSESLWCCYAWPVEAGQTGTRTFFISQDGVITQSTGRGGYSGLMMAGGRQPSFDSAYATPMGLTSPMARNSEGQDGNRWMPVQ